MTEQLEIQPADQILQLALSTSQAQHSENQAEIHVQQALGESIAGVKALATDSTTTAFATTGPPEKTDLILKGAPAEFVTPNELQAITVKEAFVDVPKDFSVGCETPLATEVGGSTKPIPASQLPQIGIATLTEGSAELLHQASRQADANPVRSVVKGEPTSEAEDSDGEHPMVSLNDSDKT